MIMDSNQKRTRLLVGMVIITFLAFFLGLGFVDNRLRVIEDHLQSIIGSPESATAKNIVYVPAYSHVYAHNGQPYLLEVTLSIRNTDPQNSVTITRADYYDNEGKLLRRYIVDPIQLTPIQSKAFNVEQTDYKGGVGANFIVEWESDRPVSMPIVDAIMIGMTDDYQISFVGKGVKLERTQ